MRRYSPRLAVKRFATVFFLRRLQNIRGETAIPPFRYLAQNTRFAGFGMSPMGVMMSGIAKKMDKDYKKNGEVKWNFTKFLIDRQGQIAARFEPAESMEKIEKTVKELL